VPLHAADAEAEAAAALLHVSVAELLDAAATALMDAVPPCAGHV
jgi:hypothetical protein